MRSVVTLLSSLAVTLHLASALPSHPAPLMQRYTLYFGSQCRYPTLGGDGVPGQTTLGAQCLDGLGVFWDTSLNLNLCLGDNDGELVYQNEGNFDASCRPCEMSDTSESGSDTSDDVILQCDCADSSGIPKYTTLTLGPDVVSPLAIKAENATLVCGPFKGTRQAIA